MMYSLLGGLSELAFHHCSCIACVVFLAKLTHDNRVKLTYDNRVKLRMVLKRGLILFIQ